MENPKIRMILCDVDGTLLLKGQNTIDDSVFHAINFCANQGISFVIASGRPYFDLKQLFAPVCDLVTFIANDGALTVKNNIILNSYQLDNDLILRFREFFNKSLFYTKDKVVNEATTSVYKLAFNNLTLSEKSKVRMIAKNTGKLTEIYSDSFWTEFIHANTNKGIAAQYLQKQMGISSLETAAFGDNTNDIEMLRCASSTFSSQTAIPEVDKMCKYKARDIAFTILNFVKER